MALIYDVNVYVNSIFIPKESDLVNNYFENLQGNTYFLCLL